MCYEKAKPQNRYKSYLMCFLVHSWCCICCLFSDFEKIMIFMINDICSISPYMFYMYLYFFLFKIKTSKERFLNYVLNTIVFILINLLLVIKLKYLPSNGARISFKRDALVSMRWVDFSIFAINTEPII